MTINVENHMQAVNSFREKASEIEADYNEAGKLKAYETMGVEITGQLDAWSQEVATEVQKIDKEIEAIKPKSSAPAADKIDTAILGYYSEQLQSRIAAEGYTKQGFLKIVEGVADHSDANMRRAFVDNFHRILQTAKEIFPEATNAPQTDSPWGDEDNQYSRNRDVSLERAAQGTGQEGVIGHLRKLYSKAQESLKSPEQKKYEAALAEAENKKSRLLSNYDMGERHLKRLKNDYESKLKGW